MNNNYSTIFIIGLPGCGKSVLSKMLAKHLNYTLYDMDSFIEQKEELDKLKQLLSELSPGVVKDELQTCIHRIGKLRECLCHNRRKIGISLFNPF